MASHLNLNDDEDDEDTQQWEICNDNGFVYKRRRRTPSATAALPRSPTSATPNRKLQTLRSRKKKTLLSLKQKYLDELSQWQHLSSSSAQFTASPSPSAAAAGVPTEPPSDAPPTPLASAEIDEMLAQVDAQEAIFMKLSEMCDYVDSMCEAEEERMVKDLIDLPIWGSPRCLVETLTSLF